MGLGMRRAGVERVVVERAGLEREPVASAVLVCHGRRRGILIIAEAESTESREFRGQKYCKCCDRRFVRTEVVYIMAEVVLGQMSCRGENSCQTR